jgi:hypothetical protein
MANKAAVRYLPYPKQLEMSMKFILMNFCEGRIIHQKKHMNFVNYFTTLYKISKQQSLIILSYIWG